MDDPCEVCLLKSNCNEVCEKKFGFINWAMNQIANRKVISGLADDVVAFLYDAIKREEKGNRAYYDWNKHVKGRFK